MILSPRRPRVPLVRFAPTTITLTINALLIGVASAEGVDTQLTSVPLFTYAPSATPPATRSRTAPLAMNQLALGTATWTTSLSTIPEVIRLEMLLDAGPPTYSGGNVTIAVDFEGLRGVDVTFSFNVLPFSIYLVNNTHFLLDRAID